MSIDITIERLIALKEYTRMRPPGRNGRPMSIATAYRHIFHGVRGVRLEHVKLGGNTYTSLEAVQRFAERLTEARPSHPTGDPRPASQDTAGRPATLPPRSRTAAARRRDIEAAERELQAAGI